MHLQDVKSAKGLLNKVKELQALLMAGNAPIYSPRIKMIQPLSLKGNNFPQDFQSNSEHIKIDSISA